MERRKARQYAIQCLYHMEMNESPARDVLQTVIQDGEEREEEAPQYEASQLTFVLSLVEGTMQHRDELDTVLHQYLQGWQLDRLSRIDRQVLRLAMFELLYQTGTPPKVVVNEAIELAKHFGTEESGKFVNGVLGKYIAKRNDEGVTS